jgi:hypothetical protein
VAVFCEPWGENPVLNLARRRLPYRGKGRTPDERPLARQDVTALRRAFQHVEVRGFQLLGMLRRAVPTGRWQGVLECCDKALLRGLPPLRRLCRYVVIEAGERGA